MEDLLFKPYSVILLTISQDQLYNDIGNKRIRFSFLQDPRNIYLQELDLQLVRRVIEVPKLRQLQFRSSQELLFRPEGIEVYIERVKAFRQLLLITIHLLYGQPTRTTKVLRIRHINTSYGGIQNIFIQYKMVCFLFLYYKGYSLSGQVKVVYRYLLRELRDLLVRYLAIILLFCQQIQLGKSLNQELSPFMQDKYLIRFSSDVEDDYKAQLQNLDKIRRLL